LRLQINAKFVELSCRWPTTEIWQNSSQWSISG